MATWKGRKTLILSGAPESDVSYVHVLLQQYPGLRVVCADAGTRQLEKLGIYPDLIVGDFDSSARPAYDCELISLVPEKDDTDTMHALQVVIDRGCTDVWIACATGGRLDHLLSNLLLCEYAFARGCRCRILDRQNELTLLAPGTATVPFDPKYRYFSLIPLDAQLKDLTITGAKYNVSHVDVPRVQAFTVSNEVAADAAQITLGAGRAFLIRASDHS